MYHRPTIVMFIVKFSLHAFACFLWYARSVHSADLFVDDDGDLTISTNLIVDAVSATDIVYRDSVGNNASLADTLDTILNSIEMLDLSTKASSKTISDNNIAITNTNHTINDAVELIRYFFSPTWTTADNLLMCDINLFNILHPTQNWCNFSMSAYHAMNPDFTQRITLAWAPLGEQPTGLDPRDFFDLNSDTGTFSGLSNTTARDLGVGEHQFAVVAWLLGGHSITRYFRVNIISIKGVGAYDESYFDLGPSCVANNPNLYMTSNYNLYVGTVPSELFDGDIGYATGKVYWYGGSNHWLEFDSGSTEFRLYHKLTPEYPTYSGDFIVKKWDIDNTAWVDTPQSFSLPFPDNPGPMATNKAEPFTDILPPGRYRFGYNTNAHRIDGEWIIEVPCGMSDYDPTLHPNI